jgi:hypothetical protein
VLHSANNTRQTSALKIKKTKTAQHFFKIMGTTLLSTTKEYSALIGNLKIPTPTKAA